MLTIKVSMSVCSGKEKELSNAPVLEFSKFGWPV